jgi:hypothetical protein
MLTIARSSAFAALAAIALTTSAAELTTDRPGQSEPPSVLPPGVWQLETGIQSSRDDTGVADRETLELGASLLRFGVSPRWEVRVAWAGWIDVDERGGFDARGAGDARVGVKVALRAAEGRSPAVSLGLATSLPVGDDAFTSDELDPSVRLDVAHTFGKVGLTWNVGVARESSAGVSNEVGVYTVALSSPLGGRLGGFVELYGELPFESRRDDEIAVDAGLYYLLRPNLQLDLSAGLGLAEAALDRFVAFGFVWRP